MITLQIINDFDNQIKLSNSLIEKIVSNVISSESKYTNIDMTIIICNDEYLRNLKIKYFDMDILTDVITFNLSEDEKDLEAEIYISWERIDDNAKIYSQKINSEVKRVIIHGCLHLVGYDDSTEKEKQDMREKEQEYMDNINKDIIL